MAERFPAGGFSSNSYLARLPFERAEIVGVEFEYLAADASVLILRASLLDSTSGAVTTLSPIHFQGTHWRKLATFGEVEIYENLKALPRAWFVSRAAVGPSADVLEDDQDGKDERRGGVRSGGDGLVREGGFRGIGKTRKSRSL